MDLDLLEYRILLIDLSGHLFFADNPLFKGGGMGLPNGDPELVINPISTTPWP